MPQFSGLPRAILLSVSALSGESYRYVGWDELKAELGRRGFTPDDDALRGAMEALRDGSYLQGAFMAKSRVELIRLDHEGRKEVEGWPSEPGSLTANDVEELVAVLQARGDDAEVPETERSKARAAAGAVRDLGVSVVAEVISAWLKRLGVG